MVDKLQTLYSVKQVVPLGQGLATHLKPALQSASLLQTASDGLGREVAGTIFGAIVAAAVGTGSGDGIPAALGKRLV